MPVSTIEDKDLLFAMKRDPEGIFIAAAECGKYPPQHIIKAYKEALDQQRYVHYGHLRGEPELREAYADKLERENGIDADSESEILITTGARGGFYAAIQALVREGDEVVTMDPSYEGNFWDVEFVNAQTVSVPFRQENGFRVVPEDIEERITARTKMIIVVNPDNPTGHVYTREELEDIAEIAQRHDLMILSDEVYEHVTYDGRRHVSIASLPDMKERTVTLFSLKEIGGSGFRVGYTVSNKDITNRMYEVHRRSCAHANLPAQMAALAALQGPQGFLQDWLREFDALRNMAVRGLNALPGVTCHTPEGGYCVFPNVSELGKSMDIWRLLVQKAKVGTVPGPWFGEFGEGYIRLVHCWLPMEGLREVLRRVRETLALSGHARRQA